MHSLPVQRPAPQIWVIKGDITKVEADAIVNAANSSLLGGGGVDGAIHRAGGPAILEDCRKIIARQGGCPTGTSVITTAGLLNARYVIHTVGPVWRGGQNDERTLLHRCYRSALELAAAHHCNSIAFPNISTGIYRFPKKEAAIIAVQTVREFLGATGSAMQVLFVCFDEENYRLTRQQLEPGELG
ncbi:MAG TPA: O-acetyl-ADP-ribose deacetylase [Chitinophagaceae bacterium]|jgi:O-acetyl-ADP-ribose deacetylase (regulator of RNase III)|nr:O-acetyl-ADP-ribose deacetylase [Chitinophagaceae bacterium]